MEDQDPAVLTGGRHVAEDAIPQPEARKGTPVARDERRQRQITGAGGAGNEGGHVCPNAILRGGSLLREESLAYAASVTAE